MGAGAEEDEEQPEAPDGQGVEEVEENNTEAQYMTQQIPTIQETKVLSEQDGEEGSATLGIIELNSSDASPVVVNVMAHPQQMLDPQQQTSAQPSIPDTEENVLLNIDSSLSLNNVQFLNSLNPPSEVANVMLPVDLRDDLRSRRGRGKLMSVTTVTSP